MATIVGHGAHSIQRYRALTCDRERSEERKEIETVGRGQGHRRRCSGGSASVDAHLSHRRRRANRRIGQNRLHLGFGTAHERSSAAGRIARVGIIDHHIAAGLLNGEQHRIPLPKRCTKLHDAEDRENKDREYQRRFHCCHSLVPAGPWVFPAGHDGHHGYCVRTAVVAVSDDGKAKLAQERIGLKLCVAVTVT